MDERIKKLAYNLVNYSCCLEKGEKVLISCNGIHPTPLVKQIIKEVYNVGAIPFLQVMTNSLERELLLGATKEQQELMAEVDGRLMEQMDAFIGVRGEDNLREQADVPNERLDLQNRFYTHPVHHGIRVPHTKWVVLRYPTNAMAQSAQTSLEDFEDFYFDVCNLDYGKMGAAMNSLVTLMNKTDKVRLVAKDTDLTFSIKDIPAVKCAGRCNIPDGEVYTAPVKNSVNGTITYNTPSEYNSFTFENVKLTFKDGKIVEVDGNDKERLEKIFNTDEGARYVGEFAIGVNPFITKPMNNILFDEKISGSIHFTPGNCYEDASNGNQSAIHWDLVLIMTPEFGGGEIWFDDTLIRKDGIFVLPELEVLNPDQLK